MIRDITMAIGIDFCGFFASSPAKKVEHNNIVTHLTFIQTCRIWHIYVCAIKFAVNNYTKWVEKAVNDLNTWFFNYLIIPTTLTTQDRLNTSDSNFASK